MSVEQHVGRTLRVAPKLRCAICGTRVADPSRRTFFGGRHFCKDTRACAVRARRGRPA